VYHGPQDVRIERIAAPVAAGPGELLVSVIRAGICGTDASEYAHGPIMIALDRPHPGSRRMGPVVLGHEFVARVDAVGEEVEEFDVGDRVVTGAGVWCGECEWCAEGRFNLCARYYSIGFHIDGGLAERALLPAFTCLAVPPACSDDNAAMAQPLSIALHGLARAAAREDESIAVIGVGGIGAFVITAASAMGMSPIVAVDIADDKLRSAAQLGATTVIDARCQDPAAAILHATGGVGAHVVVDASGAAQAPAQAVGAARRGGRVLQLALHVAPAPVDLKAVTLRELTIVGSVAHICPEDLPRALKILTDHDVASVIRDRTLTLDELVDHGLLRLVRGQASGKILVTPGGER